MKTTIDLTGWDKADVLARLYNASRPQGLGIFRFDPTPMTTKEALELLKSSTYFDYLNGRVMKVDLSGDELNPNCYDRDNYPGAAADALTRRYGWYSEKQRNFIEHSRGRAGAVCYWTPDDRAVMVTCVSPTMEHGMGFDDLVFVSEVTRMAGP